MILCLIHILLESPVPLKKIPTNRLSGNLSSSCLQTSSQAFLIFWTTFFNEHCHPQCVEYKISPEWGELSTDSKIFSRISSMIYIMEYAWSTTLKFFTVHGVGRFIFVTCIRIRVLHGKIIMRSFNKPVNLIFPENSAVAFFFLCS